MRLGNQGVHNQSTISSNDTHHKNRNYNVFEVSYQIYLYVSQNRKQKNVEQKRSVSNNTLKDSIIGKSRILYKILIRKHSNDGSNNSEPEYEIDEEFSKLRIFVF